MALKNSFGDAYKQHFYTFSKRSQQHIYDADSVKVKQSILFIIRIIQLIIKNYFIENKIFLYAFWHFDDFSWGDTRKVEGEERGVDHSTRIGSYQVGSVQLKK